MKRAYSVKDAISIKHKTIRFSNDFHEAYGEVERTGVWFIWGGTGSGKSSFVMQLCKELCKHERVIYNSLEEGVSLSFQNRLEMFDMEKEAKRFLIVQENPEELSVRLEKPKSPNVVIIDSFQYFEMNWAQYKKFKNKHKNKLIIFISQAEGKQPFDRTAKKVMYDASMKIYVEGHRATSKGRFFGKGKDYFDSWPEKAELYHGKK